MRRSKQRDLPLWRGTWGGWRPGAGRKPGPNPPVPHEPRDAFPARYPCHVTLKVREDVASLRSVAVVEEIERSFRRCERRGFRLVHYSIQGDHAPCHRGGQRSRRPRARHEVARRPLRAGGEPGAAKERARAARALSPAGLEDCPGRSGTRSATSCSMPGATGRSGTRGAPSRAGCVSIPPPRHAGSTAGGASGSEPRMQAPWTRLRCARRTRGCWAWGGEGSACSTPRRCRASWRAARPSDVGRNRPRRASFVTNLRRPRTRGRARRSVVPPPDPSKGQARAGAGAPRAARRCSIQIMMGAATKREE